MQRVNFRVLYYIAMFIMAFLGTCIKCRLSSKWTKAYMQSAHSTTFPTPTQVEIQLLPTEFSATRHTVG